MASGDLLKKLFKNYQQRDDEGFRAVAMDIVAQEQRKNHHVLARDLQRILDNRNPRVANGSPVYQFDKLPKDRERDTILLEIRSPDQYLADIVLSQELQQQVEITLQEFRASAVLRTYGLQPRRKLLFCGPPGCGKSVCAEAIAGELGLPLLYTRFDAVISSYLGETAANLRQVFDYAKRGNWVVFFDEFDAIGKSRDDTGEHGELKRVVNTFLQLLDGFNSESLFIAATNHEGLLDQALWRRFDDILYFDKPNGEQIYKLLQLKLRGFRHKKVDLAHFVPKITGWSYADIERVCFEAIKISVLTGKKEIDNYIFQRALERQSHRASLVDKSKNSSAIAAN